MKSAKGELNVIIKICIYAQVILGVIVNIKNIGTMYADAPPITLLYGSNIVLRLIALLLVLRLNKVGVFLLYFTVLAEFLMIEFVFPNYTVTSNNSLVHPIMIASFFALILLIKEKGKSGWKLLFERQAV